MKLVERECVIHGIAWSGPAGDPCPQCYPPVSTNGHRPAPAHDEPGDESDWAPHDLEAIAAGIRAGTYQPIMPTVLAVEGGHPLFYPGRINQLFGESGGGKTWVALCAVAEVVRSGKRALLIDYEDTPAGTAERLVHLGLTDEQIALVDYRNPSSGIGAGIDEVIEELETRSYGLVIVDSTGEAMASGAVNPNADEEVAMWFRYLKVFMRLPGGPAVTALDHVPKDKDAPAGYAIGSQRKRAAVTGASYRVDTPREPAKGRDGKLRLTVAKDRPGNRAKGTTAAVVDIESEDGGALTMRFHLTDAQAAEMAGERFRPTVYMERVSRWLEMHPGASQRAIAKGASGKTDMIRLAIETLLDEGWATSAVGDKGAVCCTVARPYRELDDERRSVDNSDNDSSNDLRAPARPTAPLTAPQDAGSTAPPRPSPFRGRGGGARSPEARCAPASAPLESDQGDPVDNSLDPGAPF